MHQIYLEVIMGMSYLIWINLEFVLEVGIISKLIRICVDRGGLSGLTHTAVYNLWKQGFLAENHALWPVI